MTFIPQPSNLDIIASAQVELAPNLHAEQLSIEQNEATKQGNWLSQHAGKLAVGATLASAAVTLATDPLSETQHQLGNAAPYFLGGMVSMEGLWIGGAAMMLAAVGNKVRNPLKIKSSIPELAAKANDSLLFKSGFWVNTVGAVGEFAIAASAVSTNLPPKSWGVLGLPFLDLGVTISVRRAMHRGIKKNVHKD